MVLQTTLWNALSSGEVLVIFAEFMDASSTLDLTRVSRDFYCGIPRNSSLGVQIWGKYLEDERFQANRLVFQAGKELRHSACVSRSNYKLILAVLVQKNSFMKISKLKHLCGSGKLSQPILPHKGQWRCLTRLDQFALKRATAEQNKSENAVPLNSSSTPSLSTAAKFVARICGRKGKSEMVRSHLVPLLTGDSIGEFTWVVDTLIRESNFLGVSQVVEMAIEVLGLERVNKLVFPPFNSFRSSVGDTFLHLLVRDGSLSVREKLEVVAVVGSLPSVCQLVNEVNLSHETALKLLMDRGAEEKKEVSGALLKLGANSSICDMKGNFFFFE